MTLTSDVRDVLYATWVVPLSHVNPVVPHGVKLVHRNESTLLTVLTYRHGHFGPSFFGPLRSFFPSPLQSNWRLYVSELRGEPCARTVLFIRNVFDSVLYAVGTRLFSDVLPSRASVSFEHRCSGRVCKTRIHEHGQSPSFQLEAMESSDQDLPMEFAPFFSSWQEAVQFITLQDAALAAPPDETGLAHSKIDLPVDLNSVRPMTPTNCVPGDWLKSLGAEASPLCFKVPSVRFRALSDTLIR